MHATIRSLYRYPIKGLTAESLKTVVLSAGQPIPYDRHYALALHSTQFDPQNPQYLSKTHFLMLMKNERLAALSTIFHPETHILEIYQQQNLCIRAHLYTEEGKNHLADFFANYMGDEISGKPYVVSAPNFSFSDVAAKVISCINLESIRDLEQKLQCTVHPIRFRANVYFDGLPAWEEMNWVGKEFILGTARVRVMKTITRCAATNVNPQTAVRDLSIPNALVKHYKHNCLGVYLQVLEDGIVNCDEQFIAP
jgi:uncharacterized protein YcbX